MCCFTYNSVFALSGPATIANQNISRSSLGVSQYWFSSININNIIAIKSIPKQIQFFNTCSGCRGDGGDVHPHRVDLLGGLLLLPHSEEEVPR